TVAPRDDAADDESLHFKLMWCTVPANRQYGIQTHNCRREVMSTPEAPLHDLVVSTVQDGQLTAENLSLEVGDVSFVYRRFGNEETTTPALVMLQHFRGNLDSWDPALVDRLAQEREVILLDNRGVGGSAEIGRAHV